MIKTASKIPLPGDLAMWVLILAELSVFALLFITYAVSRQLNPELFFNGQQLLHPIAGSLITIALLSASFFVAQSVNFYHQVKPRLAAASMWLAILCGLVYLVIKNWEYQQLIEQGIGLSTDSFFTYYYLLTIFHMFHVILGLGLLTYVAINLMKENWREGNILESISSYWHMVDLVWLILFPLLYLVH
ncbi:MAG: cytochrome c oxidase subunit 3 [Gammaproteobacteria bacterium]|nr:cytochrome c oxidase subunit 3 [Gammaproteobacteria bacterium]